MKVARILHKALVHEVLTGYGVNFDRLLDVDNKTLKEYDQRLVRVLDEYGSRDCLYRDYPEVFKVSVDSRLLMLYRTILNYTYKVKVEPSKQSINEAIQKLLERNESCRQWAQQSTIARRGLGRCNSYSAPSGADSELYDLLYVARWLCYRRALGYRKPLRPSHGPGTTSNAGSRRIDKYASIARDVPASLRRFSEWFVPSPSFIPEFQPLDWPSRCKLRAVPKDARGPRLIAPHSAAHMWMQQAVADRLCKLLVSQEQWFKYHPLLDQLLSTIQFDDQLVNASLALFGSSRPGLYGTIDLSDASDRIPYSLVSAIMPPALLRDLTAVRARYIALPDGDVRRLYMHAPMGSACCFPVLSLVAWSISCAAIWLCHNDRSKLGRDTIPSEFPSVFVFGDDIVIPPSELPVVTAAFERVNLKVNTTKSYCGPGGFRESCGLDAYDSEEVTPIRLKVDGVSSVSDLLALVAHRNRLAKEGLPLTAKSCEDLIEICADELGVRRLIAATPDEQYAGSAVIMDADRAKAWNRAGGVLRRLNKKLQRLEVRGLGFRVATSGVNPDLDSRSRLFEGVLGNRARPTLGWAGNRPHPVAMWIPFW